MKLTEIKQDLFRIPNDYYLAHCISDDFALGAGIAVEFNKRYKMSHKLKQIYPNGLGGIGCILVDNVFNLITKEKYYNKPTYNSLRRALESMFDQCNKLEVKKLAMPKIGCGLDRLQWGEVKKIIEEIFSGLDIEILICNL